MSKEESLAELRQYARWVSRRNPLVRKAHHDGATWSELVEASGLARQTIANILAAPQPEEDSVETTAQHFPHHPHFLSVKPGSFENRYEFKPFSGREPEPVEPDYPGNDDNDKSVYEEWRERCAEIRAARQEWQMARYHVDMEPLFQLAAKKWPKVAASLAAMREAYATLDDATRWEPAVKRLLDAQDAASEVMSDWDNTVAMDIARTWQQQPGHVWEMIPGWRRSARDMGYDSADWEVGTYYSDGYDDSPLGALESEIEKQRRRLREVASFSKQQG